MKDVRLWENQGGSRKTTCKWPIKAYDQNHIARSEAKSGAVSPEQAGGGEGREMHNKEKKQPACRGEGSSVGPVLASRTLLLLCAASAVRSAKFYTGYA
jgi:hypothetical protein